MLGVVTVRTACRCPAAGRRAPPGVEAVACAIDPRPFERFIRLIEVCLGWECEPS